MHFSSPVTAVRWVADYTFPPGLSNHDRAVVHGECKKYGFSSKSHGCAPQCCTRPTREVASSELGPSTPHGCRKDDSRQVTVYKKAGRRSSGSEPVYNLNFSMESAMALEHYFLVSAVDNLPTGRS